MTWTYTNNPSGVALDRIRLLIGDIDQCDQLLSDEELTFFLEEADNCSKTAAIEACYAIMARFSRLANESVGSVSIQHATKATQYQTLAEQMRSRLSIYTRPYAGGITVVDKDSTRLNPDRVQPSFTRELHENERQYPSGDED